MTAGEIKFIEWVLLLLGILLVFTGWRTTRKRRTFADGKEYDGKAAVRLGWLWIIIGILLILGAVFDITILKAFGRLFMETPS